MGKDNDMIYGVYDRSRGIGGCDDYFGYFKRKSDAVNEMKIQFEYLKSKNPKETITLQQDKVVKMRDKVEEVLITIHPILVR